MKREVFRARNIILALVSILVGVVLIALSETSRQPLGLRLDVILSTIGTVFIVSPIFNLFFEIAAKEKLFDEILERSDVAANLARSGIIEVHEDSTKINYKNHIDNSKTITCLFSYSGNFLKNNQHDLIAAVGKRSKLEIFHLKEDSLVLDVMKKLGWPEESMASAHRNLQMFLQAVPNAARKRVSVAEFDAIPRYSMVEFDDRMFIIENTNSLGRAKVPAVELFKESSLGIFYAEDMRKLRQAAEVRSVADAN